MTLQRKHKAGIVTLLLAVVFGAGFFAGYHCRSGQEKEQPALIVEPSGTNLAGTPGEPPMTLKPTAAPSAVGQRGLAAQPVRVGFTQTPPVYAVPNASGMGAVPTPVVPTANQPIILAQSLPVNQQDILPVITEQNENPTGSIRFSVVKSQETMQETANPQTAVAVKVANEEDGVKTNRFKNLAF